MKNLRPSLGLCAVAIAGALASSASAQDASPGTGVATTVPASVETQTPPAASPFPATRAGVLKAVQGDVKVLRADGRLQSARSGDGVDQVDRIVTGKDGGASLLLRDGTALVLGAQSQLDLKQFHFDPTTHDGGIFVSLLKGSLRMVSGLIAKKQPEAVRVDTQTATIGIRGTDFIVVADEQR